MAQVVKIFLDPGHGGQDRNNKGPTGYVEADAMLILCKKIKKELMAASDASKDVKLEVKLSRETDVTIGVRERALMAAQWGAFIAISEHSNATGKSINTNTDEVHVYESVDLLDEIFARDMAVAIGNVLGVKGKNLSWESEKYPGEDYLGFIDAAQDAGIPHVLLVENSFHDNPIIEAKLKREEVLDTIAKAQAAAICKKVGVSYPPAITPTGTQAPYTDWDQVSVWAKEDVALLKDLGIMSGDGGYFRPKDNITREQFAKAISNLLRYLRKV
jgi:N-acetylmuramoyl-L-alanine amidase